MTTLAPRDTRPAAAEHAPHYGKYIALVPDGDIVATLNQQIEATVSILRSLPESAGGRRYAEGKWSVREVICHLADSERVFTYRALSFSRGDQTPLPGFDENAFVAKGARTGARLPRCAMSTPRCVWLRFTSSIRSAPRSGHAPGARTERESRYGHWPGSAPVTSCTIARS
jgi:hypothetical protein